MTRTKGNGIPSPHAPGALSVTDGGTSIGSIVIRDGSYFSFDVDGILIAESDTQREAMLAFPRFDSKPQHSARRRARTRTTSRRSEDQA